MSNSKGLLGANGHRAGKKGRANVTMIEVGIVRDATRRSKIAFWTVGTLVGLTTGVVASGITNPIWAAGIGIVAGVVVGAVVAAVLFVWPALRVAWHWAAEIVLLTVVLAGYLVLVQSVAWWLALLILAVVLIGPLGLGTVRLWVFPWVWCAISRHRLRVCFTAFLAHRPGMAPLILLARPIPAGERVWIWLRPGLALADIESRLDKLAAGCWASECRITPASRRYSALLCIDVARRNPLTQTVSSPLAGLIPTVRGLSKRTAGVPFGLDLPDVPDTPADEPADKRRTRAITAQPSTSEPVIGDLLPPTGETEDLTNWI